MSPTTDPLAQLRDIHLPEAISWWPLATAWWVLIAVSIALIGLAFLLVLAQRRSLRSQALSELAALEKRYRTSDDNDRVDNEFLTAVGVLMRRVALKSDEARQVASLHSDEWQRYLIDGNNGLSPSLARQIAAAPYELRPATEVLKTPEAAAEVLDATRLWIRRHT